MIPYSSLKRSVAKVGGGRRPKRLRTSSAAVHRTLSIPRILKEAAQPITVLHRTMGAINYNSNSGFGGVGYGLVMAFNQTGALYALTGAVSYSSWGPSYDNATALSAVYDMYRVRTIWLDFYPSTNDYPVGTASSLAPPLMYAAVDYTDATPLLSTASALAYSDAKIYQLVGPGTADNGKPKFRLKIDRPACNVNVDSTTAGVTTNSMNARGPWLYTSNTTAEFGFVKIYVDSSILTAAVTMNLQVVVNACYEYKNLK